MASSVIRKRKKELENRYGLPIHLARQLAVSGLTDHELAPFASNLRGNVERIYYYFETGLSLHDMLIAAQQAARVVRSVKELGVSNQQMQTLTDVDKTIREALLLLKSLLINVQIRLDLRVSTPVLANPGEMVQIWMNLIKNACEAMTNAATENPELAIRSIEEEGFIKVSIADNGPGIPEDILPKIFQPNVTTKIEGLSFGLGLGLSIVQKLVEIYRGNISVESQVGLTIFRVQLPVSPINV
ncbi:MAG: GHKL domain-containing protein [Bacteroidetes bacterium]|nr:GHKL domain-containing protein [Bacteroidota bacterium]